MKNRIQGKLSGNILFIGIFLLFLYLAIETLVHFVLFNERSFSWVLSPSPHNSYHHILLAFVVIIFGTYSYTVIGKYQRAEKHHKEEKNKLKALIGAIEYGMVILDKKYNITFHNKALEDLVGSCVGDKCYHIFFNKDELCEECLVKMAFEDGKSHTTEKEIWAKDGRTIYLENTANPIRNADGEVVSCLEIIRDVTERKKKEDEIHHLNQFQESVIDDANVWLDVLDENANVIIWNKAAEQISGYSKEEVIGHNKIWEWLYPDEEYRNQIMEKVASREKVEDLETTIIIKEGEERIISWHSRNLMDSENKPIGSIAIGRDVTEQKKAEKSLKEIEEHYRTIFEHSGTAMLIIEEDTTVSMVNEEFEKISGYSREELEGKKSWTEFVHPDDLEWMRNYHVGRMMGREVPNKYEFRALDREGNYRNVLLTIEMLPNTRKSICSMTDITSIKRLNNLLKVTARMNELVAREKSPDIVLKAVCENLGLLYDGVFTALGEDIDNLEPVKSEGMDLKSIEESIRSCPSIEGAVKGNVNKLSVGREVCKSCLQKTHKYVLSIPLFHTKLYGIITLSSDYDFDEEEINLLEKVASNIAFAMNAYEVEKDKVTAMDQLAANLAQFDRSADVLRNPLSVIRSVIELRDKYTNEEAMEIIDQQARRIEEELDGLREEETKTFKLTQNLG